MKRATAIATAFIAIFSALFDPSARGYVVQSTVPQAGGCPQPDRWNLSLASPLNRRWSTTLPLSPPRFSLWPHRKRARSYLRSTP